MNKRGLTALLVSALLLEGLGTPPAVGESRHGRRAHKRPRPDLPEPPTENVEAEKPKPAPAPAAASVDVRITIDPPNGIAPPPPPPVPVPVILPPPPLVTPRPPAPVVAAPPPPAMPMAPPPAAQNPFAPQFPVAAAPVAAPSSRGGNYRTLALAGAGIVGSTYALTLILGGASYGSFTSGQWGWFIPVAGPAVVMSGACGNPNGCYFKTVFTYITGPFATAAYLTGLTMALVGAVGMKSESKLGGRVALLPIADRDTRGLILSGSF